MSLRKGQIVPLSQEGRFKVGNKIGSGAFGDVYSVRKMGRQGWDEFALKVIACNDAHAIEMAVREARTLKKVKHENIVQIIHAEMEQAPRNSINIFILTEYCSGGNLNDRLRNSTQRDTKLQWLCQLASAITYLHSRRPMIVHRDLKPANVLLTADEDLKIADFGLARQYEALKQLGSSGSLLSYYMMSGVGTRAYVAPEVLANHYTEKADIFSLGAIFYAILEECYIEGSRGSRLYGAFVDPDECTPLGEVMYYKGNSKPREELDFQTTYEVYDKAVAKELKSLVRQCVLYRSGLRPKARQIRDILERLSSTLDSSESESEADLESHESESNSESDSCTYGSRSESETEGDSEMEADDSESEMEADDSESEMEADDSESEIESG